jgi:hypothetical protein
MFSPNVSNNCAAALQNSIFRESMSHRSKLQGVRFGLCSVDTVQLPLFGVCSVDTVQLFGLCSVDTVQLPLFGLCSVDTVQLPLFGCVI